MKTLYSIAKKHNIPYSTLYSRLRVQGLTLKQALKYTDKRGGIYNIMASGKFITRLYGAAAVAEWLSKRTRTHITKSMIIGRMYRKRNKIITVDKYTIIREW